MPDDCSTGQERPAEASASQPAGRGPIDVERLFGGSREIRLRFQNEEYRLRITRSRKLILTK
jgi:hemin uptake protein HemP